VLLPRISSIIIGVIVIRTLGVELYGEYMLSLSTGLLLLQFIPDAISTYCATKIGSRYEIGSQELARIVSEGFDIAIRLSVPAMVAVLIISTQVEPFAQNSRLRDATLMFLLGFPFLCTSQVLGSQLSVLGFERRVMFASVATTLAQLAFSLVGASKFGVMGLAVGITMAAALSAALMLAIYEGPAKRVLQRGECHDVEKIRLRLTVPAAIVRLCGSFAMGVPVHWFIMRMLAASEGGMYQVGIFAYAYYFYTFLIIIPSSMQSYIVGTLARFNSKRCDSEGGVARGRPNWSLIVIGALLLAIFICVLHWLMSPIILGADRNIDTLSPGFLGITSGVIGVAAILASQYLMSLRFFGFQLSGTVVAATTYAGFSYIFAIVFSYGANGVLIALGLAQAIQTVYILIMLKRFRAVHEQ
jgi:hypothetical protein